MTEDTFKRVSVSLNDQDLANLHQIGKDVGVLNRSATIRFLIKYFQRNELESQHILRERSMAYTTEQSR